MYSSHLSWTPVVRHWLPSYWLVCVGFVDFSYLFFLIIVAFVRILVQFQRANCLQQLSSNLWAIICISYFHHLPHKPSGPISHLFKNCWQRTSQRFFLYTLFLFYELILQVYNHDSFHTNTLIIAASMNQCFSLMSHSFQDSDNKHKSSVT